MMEVNPLIAFGAGVVSILSPCVLPLLPAIIASSTESGRYRPLAIVVGLSISFTMMGLTAAAFGSIFQSFADYINAAAIVIIITMGVWMLFNLHLPYNMPRLGIINKVSNESYKLSTEGIGSGLLLGLSLGIVWLPCTGPVLGTILTWVASKGNILIGGTLLLVYSLGFAVPMLGIAYSTKMSSALAGKTAKMIWIRRIAGFALILVGVYLLNPSMFR